MIACPLVDDFALHVEKERFASAKRYVESVAFEGFRVVADESAFLGMSPCRGHYGDPEGDKGTIPTEPWGFREGVFHALIGWGLKFEITRNSIRCREEWVLLWEPF